MLVLVLAAIDLYYIGSARLRLEASTRLIPYVSLMSSTNKENPSWSSGRNSRMSYS
jgi:hypothetical protein